MTDIAIVIGWKFNHQPGMRTRDGKITEFPGGIPAQADQDTWTTEYLARDISAERVDSAFTLSDKDRVIFEAFFELINRVLALENKVAIDRSQLKNWLKTPILHLQPD